MEDQGISFIIAVVCTNATPCARELSFPVFCTDSGSSPAWEDPQQGLGSNTGTSFAGQALVPLSGSSLPEATVTPGTKTLVTQ